MSLSHTKRLELTKYYIQHAFDRFARHSKSAWGVYNGGEHYNICRADEFKTLLNIIDNNPTKKEFYILDVGAGDFQFSENLAFEVNRAIDSGTISSDIKFHIIGLRAERNIMKEITEKGNCKIYNFGNFVVENLIDGLSERGLGDVKFDLAVSHWCLRHLVDPVGTVMQIHEMLSSEPNTGYFFFDSFILEIEGLTPGNDLCRLLYSFNEPFIMCPAASRQIDFILKKTQDNLDVPLNYLRLKNIDETSWIAASGVCQVFAIEEGKSMVESLEFPMGKSYSFVRGDKQLFDLLKDWGVFYNFFHQDDPDFPEYAGPILPVEQASYEQLLPVEQTLYEQLLPVEQTLYEQITGYLKGFFDQFFFGSDT